VILGLLFIIGVSVRPNLGGGGGIGEYLDGVLLLLLLLPDNNVILGTTFSCSPRAAADARDGGGMGEFLFSRSLISFFFLATYCLKSYSISELILGNASVTISRT
jgi:hypothetical protein